ncbi:asparaginase [Streptomyces sp. VRA16 Mangrove soil]|uniref:asparaginase n=1 Tax=Streptomyces sp. VRA16 Mangrove soil TaxID=2817434 RepID=UPI001A9F8B31|nr:asparaginase [Streptomyces sp. VRA16 Mangrove soil]MBO1334526.1 asparaginase [Streptomyces sp. VRA16 Mangrove soil]
MSTDATSPTPPAHEVLAEVWRGDFLESVHHGAVLVVGPDGGTKFSAGQVDVPLYPRSSNKPLQGVGMLRAGLGLDGELLALACASHSGEAFHLDGVRRILAGAGLTEGDLRCTEGLPIGAEAQPAHLAAGRGPTRTTMNCSGKHAAMLATCVAAGWSVEDYLDPGHPLQLALRETLEDLAGETSAAVGVDGCGAPLFALSLTGLARAFARIATAPAGSHEQRVAAAMNAYPEYVGGTGRDVTDLMRALPGAVAKDGAEGVYALALPDGSAVALKIADGAARPRPVVMAAALRHLGVDIDADPRLAALAEVPVLGHGEPVGAVRPAGPLARA